MKPWEKYAQKPAPAEGPWTKYQQADPDAARRTEQSERWAAAKDGTLEASPESLARHAEADQIAADQNAPGFLGQVADVAGAGLAGLSRGVTGMADLPGMLVGGAGNLAAAGVEKLGAPGVAQGMRDSFGMMPMGDGDLFRGGAAAATGGASEFRGDTTAGKYAGTVGEFIPGSMLGGGGGTARNLLAYGVVPGIASEGAGQLTEGTALEPWARVVAPIVASAVAGRMTRAPGPKAPTVDELRAQADDLYQAGKARPAATPQAVDDLRMQMETALRDNSRMTPTGRVTASGNVKSFLDVLGDYSGQPMRPDEMQNLRSFLTDAAKSTDAGERRLASILLDQFDNWRGQHVPEFRQADQIYGRMKRGEDMGLRFDTARRRAAKSGTGGNYVNSARQKIDEILNKPHLQRGYSPAEMAMMDQIVSGTPLTNALRLGGRLSPTSGAFPLGGALAAGVVGGSTGNPLLMIPPVAGWLAKGGAEVLTGNQLNALAQTVLNGAPLPANGLAQLDRAALGLLAGRAATSERGRPRNQ